MKTITRWLACMLLATNAASLVGQETPDERLVGDLLKAHNKEREAEKLPDFTLDPMLTKAAKVHADDMAGRREMSHEGADGSVPADRVKRTGYHYLRVGENVAKGQRGVTEAMKSWMNSEGHRKNILGEYTQIGAARVRDDDDVPYWCVVFGVPLPKLDPDRAAAEVLEAVNAARNEAGKEPLKADPRLDGVARALAAGAAGDAKKPTEERKPPDVATLMTNAGVAFRGLAQCMGAGEPTPTAFVKDLLASDRQKEALLGAVRSIGIGYARDEDDVPYWCLLMVEE